jgi:2-phosphoglycerate kinase
MWKPVVLIGGAPGTGKSTLAQDLSCRLHLDHRIGTGFIRAVLQSESDPKVEPNLFSLTFASDDPVANLEQQAERLRAAVMACVRRAKQEGTSLIVEGSHLTPALYAREAVDLFVVLAAPSADEHLTRLTGPTHANRAISPRDWENVQRLNTYYVEEATRWGATTVVYGSQLDAIISLIEQRCA